MSEHLFYKLGRGSLQEAKSSAKSLLKDFAPEIGEVAVYLDEESLDDLIPGLIELQIKANINYLKRKTRYPASVCIDFLVAFIKSRRKLLVSDRDIQEAREELL